MTPDPYHDGERQVRARTGETDAAILDGGVIADAVPAAATSFVAQRVLSVAARTGGDGVLWPVALSGAGLRMGQGRPRNRFADGRQLCLTGPVGLDIEGPREAPAGPTGGTGRGWTFRPDRRVSLPLGVEASEAADPSSVDMPLPEAGS